MTSVVHSQSSLLHLGRARSKHIFVSCHFSIKIFKLLSLLDYIFKICIQKPPSRFNHDNKEEERTVEGIMCRTLELNHPDLTACLRSYNEQTEGRQGC